MLLKSIKIICYDSVKKMISFLKNWWVPIIIGLGIALFGTTLIRLISFRFLNIYYQYFNHPLKFDTETTAQIGDTFGGTSGPYIALIASFLTFIAFWVQFQANKEVQKQFEIQKFENQFYEMLRLHRANIDEMNIASKINGRKCFVRMFYEYKFIYLKLNNIYSRNEVYKKLLTKEDLCKITYNVFFFGVGINTEEIIYKLIDPKCKRIAGELIENLTIIQQDWKNGQELYVNNENGSNFKYIILYKPFDGHNNRLGHYYRHLYQSVSYVVNSNIIKDRSEKYKYLKLLRAQLSNHEQLLLYYNSLTKFGEGWIENKYFTNYKMIKNIPLEFADFGLKPKDKLGKINEFNENIFEWDEL
jgi:hypothetical protein